jgi:hypothetical protein
LLCRAAAQVHSNRYFFTPRIPLGNPLFQSPDGSSFATAALPILGTAIFFGLCNLPGTVRLMAVCWDFLWSGDSGRSRAGDSAMANERKFPEQWAYERRLMEDGTLRRRALALIVIGLAFIVMGGANLDLFAVTVGLIGVAAGGIWRWCLT